MSCQTIQAYRLKKPVQKKGNIAGYFRKSFLRPKYFWFEVMWNLFLTDNNLNV